MSFTTSNRNNLVPNFSVDLYTKLEELKNNSSDEPQLTTPAQEPITIHIPKYDIIREVVAPLLSSQDKLNTKSLSSIIQSLIRNSTRMIKAENSYDDLCHISTAFATYFNEGELVAFENFLAKCCIELVEAKIAQKQAIHCFFHEKDKENAQKYSDIVRSVTSEVLSKEALTQNKTLNVKLSQIEQSKINEFEATIRSTSQSKKRSRKITPPSKFKTFNTEH